MSRVVFETTHDGRIEVELGVDDPGWFDLENVTTLVSRACAVTLDRNLPDGRASLFVALGDDAESHRLNHAWRQIDGPTDVLSFPSHTCTPFEFNPHPDAQSPTHLGDIMIARETMFRDAEACGMSASDRLVHLVVHGVLHLLGYDHQTESDAENMEALERQALCELGVSWH